MEWLKQANGQSVLEIIIALAIFVMIGSAGFVLFGTVLSQNQHIADHAQAQQLLREGFEAVRQIRDRDFGYLVPGVYGLTHADDVWEFSGESDTTNERLTRAVTITELDAGSCAGTSNEREVTVEVSWLATPSRFVDISATTRFTNWRSLAIWGDWASPASAGSTDIGSQGQGSGVSAFESYAAVTADISAASKASFYIMDVSDPTNPTLEGSVVTTASLFDAIALPEEELVYTAGALQDEELNVFSVTTPSAPSWLQSLDLNADGSDLFRIDDSLYVAAVNGLHIIDISDPTTPSEVGSLNFGAEANGVVVQGDYAYVAGSANSEELIIIDVSDQENPTEGGSYDISGNDDGLSVEISGTYLYIGTEEKPSGGAELYVFDLADPLNPTLLDSVDIEGGVNDMHAEGSYLFVVSAASNSEFKVYCVADPTNLTEEGNLNLSQTATDFSLLNNTAYVSMRSNNALQIIQPTP